MTKTLVAAPMRPLPADVKATTTAIEFPETLRFKDWEEIGEQLFMVQSVNLWWIAGWAAHGDRQYRRDYGPALEQIYNRRSLHNLASIYRRVDPHERRENLSFGHHEAVASLDPDLQGVWLDDALRHGWSVHELRAHIATHKGRKGAAPAISFRAIGELHDLCVQAAEKLGVDPGEFARQALEEKAREVLSS
jgi:hypothetical protein